MNAHRPEMKTSYGQNNLPIHFHLLSELSIKTQGPKFGGLQQQHKTKPNS